ncbi:hydrophobic protein [Streptomyces sp. NPDC056161]|uniref:hydrophobic protein n=1 Tax=Streptomyces sp. NPDC056161 TaxID=3345732 RepID=UPI0035DBB1E0
MIPILLVLLVVLILFGIGFLVKLLWWIALALLVVWLLGLLVRGLMLHTKDRDHDRQHHW